MGYRPGVDVGGTFTDLLLFDDASGAFWRHKTPSTRTTARRHPGRGRRDLRRRRRRRARHRHRAARHDRRHHAVLEGKGARVGLIVTTGYRQVMQIARSYVHGGLAGWIIWPKPEPMARLEDTIEVGGASTDGAARSRRSTKPARARRCTG